jgi:hypothetical protein
MGLATLMTKSSGSVNVFASIDQGVITLVDSDLKSCTMSVVTAGFVFPTGYLYVANLWVTAGGNKTFVAFEVARGSEVFPNAPPFPVSGETTRVDVKDGELLVCFAQAKLKTYYLATLTIVAIESKTARTGLQYQHCLVHLNNDLQRFTLVIFDASLFLQANTSSVTMTNLTLRVFNGEPQLAVTRSTERRSIVTGDSIRTSQSASSTPLQQTPNGKRPRDVGPDI